MVLESFDQIIVSLQESNSTQSVESIDHAIAEGPGQQVSEKKKSNLSLTLSKSFPKSLK